MKRDKLEDLKKWQKSKTRKPLVLSGARQVGKTWLLKEFGRQAYKNVAYISCDNNTERLTTLFSLDVDTDRIIAGLEIMSGTKITAGDTLIILDEIQEIPKAITALKYFCENAPDYHIATSGSLLGLTMHQKDSFPVGKVNSMTLYPLNFAEFLSATGKDDLRQLLDKPATTKPFHQDFLNLLKTYFIVGGMPEVVQNYIESGNMLETRKIQNEILSNYERDFSKHAPASVVPKINDIFQIIPKELTKENKKFIFGLIKTGARAKEYETALLWLENAGLVKRIFRVNSAKIPLVSYVDRGAFKLFFIDIGLLGAKADVPIETLLDEQTLFTEFKGAMTEQYVAQEFTTAGVSTFYYSRDDSRGEIDFMINHGTQNIPVEVKSGRSLQSKALNAFLVNNPKVNSAIKFSMLEFAKNNTIINAPLYDTDIDALLKDQKA